MEVWLSLTEIFGSGFLTMNGKEPEGRWLNCINELTDEQIKNGLHRLEYIDDDEYPPGVKRFRSACTYTKPYEHFQLPAPEYGLNEAKAAAVSAGCSLDEVEGKTVEQLEAMRMKARFGKCN